MQQKLSLKLVMIQENQLLVDNWGVIMMKISINSDGTITLVDENTTIGYAVTDTSKSELSYLFVNPAFRRRGFGTLLLKEAEKMAGSNLIPAEPISPLGRKFFNHNSHV